MKSMREDRSWSSKKVEDILADIARMLEIFSNPDPSEADVDELKKLLPFEGGARKTG